MCTVGQFTYEKFIHICHNFSSQVSRATIRFRRYFLSDPKRTCTLDKQTAPFPRIRSRVNTHTLYHPFISFHWRIQGSARDVYPPLGLISFIFMLFPAKILTNNDISPNSRVYAPPVVVKLVRMTLLAEIELIHFSDLSSRGPNCQDNIQLFIQQLERISVHCVTNWHYKVLGVRQTSEWHFTHLRSQLDSLLSNCSSVYELYVKYCPRAISPYLLQNIWELSHVFSCLFRRLYINQCKFHSIISFSSVYPLVQHVLPRTSCSSTYE